MTDSRGRTESLEESWSALGRSLAVAAGALAAFVSLYCHVPVWVASLRGAISFCAVALVCRASRGVLAWVHAKETRDAKPKAATNAQRSAPRARS